MALILCMLEVVSIALTVLGCIWGLLLSQFVPLWMEEPIVWCLKSLFMYGYAGESSGNRVCVTLHLCANP